MYVLLQYQMKYSAGILGLLKLHCYPVCLLQNYLEVSLSLNRDCFFLITLGKLFFVCLFAFVCLYLSEFTLPPETSQKSN